MIAPADPYHRRVRRRRGRPHQRARRGRAAPAPLAAADPLARAVGRGGAQPGDAGQRGGRGAGPGGHHPGDDGEPRLRRPVASSAPCCPRRGAAADGGRDRAGDPHRGGWRGGARHGARACSRPGSTRWWRGRRCTARRTTPPRSPGCGPRHDAALGARRPPRDGQAAGPAHGPHPGRAQPAGARPVARRPGARRAAAEGRAGAWRRGAAAEARPVGRPGQRPRPARGGARLHLAARPARAGHRRRRAAGRARWWRTGWRCRRARSRGGRTWRGRGWRPGSGITTSSPPPPTTRSAAA